MCWVHHQFTLIIGNHYRPDKVDDCLLTFKLVYYILNSGLAYIAFYIEPIKTHLCWHGFPGRGGASCTRSPDKLINHDCSCNVKPCIRSSGLILYVFTLWTAKQKQNYSSMTNIYSQLTPFLHYHFTENVVSLTLIPSCSVKWAKNAHVVMILVSLEMLHF